ncbi:GntR family transcriptional regulator [Microvirga sp. BT689]|uniref:GntR family transcriptional regulator n=1 Tax=Microvirga arvi TaxID=2778731 RepID=UPI001950C8FF|nr:GntR family transcriptional regulator [Microvirga arvi]MBM6581896.1 GntR family transcriptional regulator [Microvirga arvi]
MAHKDPILPTGDAFPQPKRLLLTDSIADSIAEAISTRHLLPGDRVVETTLAERLGVSRVPIREALRVLHAQGILTGGSHKGYRVADFGPETTQQVFEVRLALETFLLRDAIRNWRDGLEDINALEVAIEMMKRAAKIGDVRASLVADLEFHRTISIASRNPITSALWEAIARHVLIIFNFERYRDKNLMAVAEQHRDFMKFLQRQIKTPGPENVLHNALENHMLLIERSRRRSNA